MDLKTENSMYKTKDLGFASALISLGYPLAGSNKNGKDIMFIVDIQNAQTPVHDLEKMYYSGNLSGDLNAHYQAVKNLKTIIYKMNREEVKHETI